jgi:ketosteroid isomerase-like protein
MTPPGTPNLDGGQSSPQGSPRTTAAERSRLSLAPIPMSAVDVAALIERYMKAFNERDLDVLLTCMHPEIMFYPTKISSTRSCYVGHDGVREWMDDVIANPAPYLSRMAELRQVEPDRWAVFGSIVLHEEATSPYAVTVHLRDGTIVELRAYLSDAELLQHLGRMP